MTGPMRDTRNDDDDVNDERVEREGVELALDIEQQIEGRSFVVVIFALCWILASLIVQAEREYRFDTKRAIRNIVSQLTLCVVRLRERLPSVH
jgi:hypothetical protein